MESLIELCLEVASFILCHLLSQRPVSSTDRRLQYLPETPAASRGNTVEPLFGFHGYEKAKARPLCLVQHF